MDRHLVAYVSLAILLLALAALAAWVRYNSRHQVLRRSRHADRARWARRRANNGSPTG